MNLKYLKGEQCPVCGCTLIIEEGTEHDKFSSILEYREHCNGGRWEHRLFACGQKLEYTPNFSKTELSTYYKSTNNDEYKLIKYKQQKFKEATKQFILSYDDVDNSSKDNMIDKIRY